MSERGKRESFWRQFGPPRREGEFLSTLQLAAIFAVK
jgi:hypothetical protein